MCSATGQSSSAHTDARIDPTGKAVTLGDMQSRGNDFLLALFDTLFLIVALQIDG
jgi:hypothetical protein